MNIYTASCPSAGPWFKCAFPCTRQVIHYQSQVCYSFIFLLTIKVRALLTRLITTVITRLRVEFSEQVCTFP